MPEGPGFKTCPRCGKRRHIEAFRDSRGRLRKACCADQERVHGGKATCSYCGQRKNAEEFDRRGRTGLSSFCWRCRGQLGRARGKGHAGESTAPVSVEEIARKYGEHRDRLMARKFKGRERFPDAANVQLALVSEVVRDLERLEASS